MGSSSPTIVVADLHLTRHTPREVGTALARVITAHPGSRLVVAGDLLDRSAESSPPSLDELFDRHPSLRRALGEHLTRGAELVLTAGNHDAELVESATQRDLARALALDARAAERVVVSPWIWRAGGLHVEHGHLYDPDNAPAHPLVTGAPSLGVRFVRDFIAPTRAYAYLNRNDKMPLELFIEAFTRYGLRGPFVVARFFRVAFAALGAAGRAPIDEERAQGAPLLRDFAARIGVPASELEALAGRAPSPTMADALDTFARLYLDRVAATVSLLGGGTLALLGHQRAATAAFAFGAVAMLASWARARDRYGGRVAERLADGARLVRDVTGAHAVVFGHAHKPEVRDGYANPGSFAFPTGAERTYLRIGGTDEHPAPELLGVSA